MMKHGETSGGGDLNAEIVVVGGGGSGLAAAVSAAEKGAKVIVLEKRIALGGTSAMAGGIFAAESPVQKRMMIDAPRDQLFKAAMDYAHWRIDPMIVRAFIDKSGDTVRWLEEKGLKFGWIPAIYPNQVPPVLHWPEGRGAALIKVLVKNCEDLGVKIICQAPVKKILTGEKENLTGVLAATKEKELVVTAKSVIIATGGFGGNKELLKKYYPSYNENMICSGIPNMGDGLLMATEIGAATEGLGTLLLSGPVVPGSSLLFAIAGEPGLVLVNKKGERFTDENIPTHFERGNPLDRQPGKICYALFDEGTKRNIVQEGLKRPGWGLNRRQDFILPQIELTELEKELRLQASKGIAKVSDSWDEIAKWMEAAPEVLKATIEEYNSFCDQRHDKLFVKDPRYLLPLRTPPYNAIKCYLGFHGTIGGIKINHRMEVLNNQDKPIPGLYAAGTDTGGWQGDTYCGRDLPGIAFGFAVNSGRIAGENAASILTTRK